MEEDDSEEDDMEEDDMEDDMEEDERGGWYGEGSGIGDPAKLGSHILHTDISMEDRTYQKVRISA